MSVADGLAFGNGVVATLVSSNAITLTGLAQDINAYFDVKENIQYFAPAIGDNVAVLDVALDDGGGAMSIGMINIDVREEVTFHVTTALDVVDPLDGVTSLREAILLSNDQATTDTITFAFDLSGQTIALDSGPFVISDSLTIDAAMLDENIILDGQRESHLLDVDDALTDDESSDITLRKMTLTRGQHETGNGGAIRMQSQGSLILEQSLATDNHATGNGTGRGGAIYVATADLSLIDSTLEDNSSSVGGAIFSMVGTVLLQDSFVSGNTSDAEGISAGGIYAREGDLTIRDSTISGNSASGDGGGIYVRYGDTQITRSLIRYNNAAGKAGGISSLDGMVILTDSIVDSNFSNDSGGGIYARRRASVELHSSQVNYNASAVGDGGGIHAPNLVAIDSSLTGNISGGRGGAVYVADLASLQGTTIRRNSSVGPGGGIYSNDGSVEIGGASTVSENATNGPDADGGGVKAPTVTVVESIISSNQTLGESSDGGGISAYYTSLDTSDVSGNSVIGSQSRGGGIYGRVTSNNSSITGNSSRGSGGGIYMRGQLVITNSTISQNHSEEFSGGLFVRRGNFGTQGLDLSDSTVTQNVAETGGGIYTTSFLFFDEFNLTNSIVADNSAAVAPDVVGRPDASFSLIGVNAGTQLTPTPAGATDSEGNLIGSTSIPIAPLLRPLADNGGGTLTHLPTPGSPVVDAGNSALDMDQRGVPRSVDTGSAPNSDGGNGSDMGAVELLLQSDSYFPESVTVVKTAATSDLDLSSLLVVSEADNVIVTITADSGSLFDPGDGSGIGDGVTTRLISEQSIELSGAAIDINRYFDLPGILQYLPVNSGLNAALLTITIDDGSGPTVSGDVTINCRRPSGTLVTTTEDVTDPFDEEVTLREALTFASAHQGSARVRFLPGLSGQTISLQEGVIYISDDVIIDASYFDEALTIDAQDTSRIFRILDTPEAEDNFDVTFNNLNLTGGHTEGDGGAVLATHIGDLTIIDSRISGNYAARNGGGVSALDVEFNSSTIGENSSDQQGGGVFSRQATFTDSQISNNTSGVGGGVHATEVVSAYYSTFSNNEAAGHGGGIFSGGDVTISNSSVIRNTATESGGGIYSDDDLLRLENSTVSQNVAGINGGGVSAAEDIRILSTTITANEAMTGDGGG
ncbi:MAG: choice-of-anchor Q domain-containing protein, partial [Planctomycetota bacterium]